MADAHDQFSVGTFLVNKVHRKQVSVHCGRKILSRFVQSSAEPVALKYKITTINRKENKTNRQSFQNF